MLTALAEVPVQRVNKIGEKRAEACRRSTSPPSSISSRTTRAATSTGPGKPTWPACRWARSPWCSPGVDAVRTRRTRQGRALVELDVDDGTGALRVVFFNQAWRAKQLPVGTEALFFGKLDSYRGKRQFTNPVVDLVGNRTGRDRPDLSRPRRSRHRRLGVRRVGRRGPAPGAGRSMTRCLRGGVTSSSSWGARVAFRAIHAPESFAEKEAARRRLAFDELLRLQLEVVMRRHESSATSGASATWWNPARRRHLISSTPSSVELPFPLTAAQRRAIDEISADLAGPLPMHRLLQGDVGSGKTVVAVAAPCWRRSRAGIRGR